MSLSTDLNGCVLIVDDDEHVLRSCRRLCDVLELPSLVAHSLTETRAILENWATQPCRYVLLDNRLMNESGLEIVQSLRELEPPPAVALVSAYLDSEVALSAFRLGAIPMAKPSSADDLRKLLMLLELSHGRVEFSEPGADHDEGAERDERSERDSAEFGMNALPIEFPPLVLSGKILVTPTGTYSFRRMEARLLARLMSLRGESASPQDLALAVLNRNDDGAVGSIYSHIANIRLRLGPCAPMLQTVAQQGYCINLSLLPIAADQAEDQTDGPQAVE